MVREIEAFIWRTRKKSKWWSWWSAWIHGKWLDRKTLGVNKGLWTCRNLEYRWNRLFFQGTAWERSSCKKESSESGVKNIKLDWLLLSLLALLERMLLNHWSYEEKLNPTASKIIENSKRLHGTYYHSNQKA